MPRHARRGKGVCQWCGEDILQDGEINKRRTWHPDCLADYFLHTRAENQKGHLIERDGIHCAACREAPGAWEALGVFDPDVLRSYGPGWVRSLPSDVWGGPYTGVSWSSGLEVEHIVPLWRVAHLPDDDRRWYFGPGNLQLLCPSCHKGKTSLEAALRAELDRLAR